LRSAGTAPSAPNSSGWWPSTRCARGSAGS
jgi:hypothetical protein